MRVVNKNKYASNKGKIKLNSLDNVIIVKIGLENLISLLADFSQINPGIENLEKNLFTFPKIKCMSSLQIIPYD